MREYARVSVCECARVCERVREGVEEAIIGIPRCCIPQLDM